MKKSDFYYDLPERLIAQSPSEQRDHSRLMRINRARVTISDNHFYDLEKMIMPGDCLILNDSRVLPARIFGVRTNSSIRNGVCEPDSEISERSGINEFLLLHQNEMNVWETITRPGKRARAGAKFIFGDRLMCGEVIKVLENGNRIMKFKTKDDADFYSVLDQIGQIPLPPYITEKLEDKERYQTVYSNEIGSAAAPTAGLHFTLDMLERLKEKGVGIGYVTLHVGLGTFRPVKADNISEHTMHAEHYVLPKETADLINETKKKGGRVICVGTTSCRTLESCAFSNSEFRIQNSELAPQSGWTDIFIYPGYKFKIMDALITNFHLPESTLIMLVSAFAGRDLIMQAYKRAVEKEYRFFSFGDAMFID